MAQNDITLRHVLLTATRDLHDALDQRVGTFSDARGYGAFLAGSHAFRAGLEPLLSGWQEWRVQPLAGLIGQDLADLGLSRPPSVAGAIPPSPAARAAACYVLEGSSLGARLLVRRAEALGFTGKHGARHLAAQVADRQRWPRFLDWLERSDVRRSEAALAARDIFTLALRAYGAEAEA